MPYQSLSLQSPPIIVIIVAIVIIIVAINVIVINVSIDVIVIILAIDVILALIPLITLPQNCLLLSPQLSPPTSKHQEEN